MPIFENSYDKKNYRVRHTGVPKGEKLYNNVYLMNVSFAIHNISDFDMP